jgi:hypothetical protein
MKLGTNVMTLETTPLPFTQSFQFQYDYSFNAMNKNEAAAVPGNISTFMPGLMKNGQFFHNLLQGETRTQTTTPSP